MSGNHTQFIKQSLSKLPCTGFSIKDKINSGNVKTSAINVLKKDVNRGKNK